MTGLFARRFSLLETALDTAKISLTAESTGGDSREGILKNKRAQTRFTAHFDTHNRGLVETALDTAKIFRTAESIGIDSGAGPRFSKHSSNSTNSAKHC